VVKQEIKETSIRLESCNPEDKLWLRKQVEQLRDKENKLLDKETELSKKENLLLQQQQQQGQFQFMASRFCLVAAGLTVSSIPYVA